MIGQRSVNVFQRREWGIGFFPERNRTTPNVDKTSVLFFADLSVWCTSEQGFILTAPFFHDSLDLITRSTVQGPSFLAIWAWMGHSYSHYTHKQHDCIIFAFEYIKKPALGRSKSCTHNTWAPAAYLWHSLTVRIKIYGSHLSADNIKTGCRDYTEPSWNQIGLWENTAFMWELLNKNNLELQLKLQHK